MYLNTMMFFGLDEDEQEETDMIELKINSCMHVRIVSYS